MAILEFCPVSNQDKLLSCVYRIWFNELYYYIGCTDSFYRRLKQHAINIKKVNTGDIAKNGSNSKYDPSGRLAKLLATESVVRVRAEILSTGLDTEYLRRLEILLLRKRKGCSYILNAGGSYSGVTCFVPYITIDKPPVKASFSQPIFYQTINGKTVVKVGY